MVAAPVVDVHLNAGAVDGVFDHVPGHRRLEGGGGLRGEEGCEGWDEGAIDGGDEAFPDVDGRVWR